MEHVQSDPCWLTKKSAGRLKNIVLGGGCIVSVFEGEKDVQQMSLLIFVSQVSDFAESEKDQHHLQYTAKYLSCLILCFLD